MSRPDWHVDEHDDLEEWETPASRAERDRWRGDEHIAAERARVRASSGAAGGISTGVLQQLVDLAVQQITQNLGRRQILFELRELRSEVAAVRSELRALREEHARRVEADRAFDEELRALRAEGGAELAEMPADFDLGPALEDWD